MDDPIEFIPMTNPRLRLLLTVDEAAAALGISRTLCYRLLTGRQMRSVKVGNARRIPVVALQEFVAQLSDGQKAG
jgi:excisionase family DNA binding protein